MKKNIFFLLSFFIAAHSFAQQIETLPPLTKQDYFTRSKQQKTAAWMLTGVGTVGLLLTSAAEVGQTIGGGMMSLFSLGTVEPE